MAALAQDSFSTNAPGHPGVQFGPIADHKK